MNIYKSPKNSVVTALVLSASLVIARAGAYTWSSPTPITTAEAALNLPGTIVGAETFGSIEEIVTLTNGAVIDFKTDGSAASAAGYGMISGTFTGDTGNTHFNYALSQATYDGDPNTITINNLTAGQQYSVQLFALDQRTDSGENTNEANFQDPNDSSDVSATFAMGGADYVVGTFTATSSSTSIQENLLPYGAGNINAAVVRNLSSQQAPQILTQPQSKDWPLGQAVQFNVNAYGTSPLSYQWQAGTVGSGIFTNLNNDGHYFGVTNAMLTVNNIQAADVADYHVIVNNGEGSVTSSPATLQDFGLYGWSAPVPISTADAALNQPGTIVEAEAFGQTEKLVSLTNGQVIDFKVDISAAKVNSDPNGQRVGDGCFKGDTGNPNLNTALSQFDYGSGSPAIIKIKSTVVGHKYQVQVFSLDQRSDSGEFLNQVNYMDTTNGELDNSQTISMGDCSYVIGTFTADATTHLFDENLPDNGAGNINAVILRDLTETSVQPTIVYPTNQTIMLDSGLTVQFKTAVYGTTPLSYQWQAGAVGSGIYTNLSNGGPFSGVNTATLTITGLTTNNTADYRMFVTNSAGSTAGSKLATLTVQPQSPLYTWWAPVPITSADATLDLPGTIVGAEVFGTTEELVTLTNSAVVDFKADGSVATASGAGTTTGAYTSQNTGNANFNATLSQFNYDNGSKTITLYNLTVGQQYSVQLFALDQRYGGQGAFTRTANFQDPNDNSDISATFNMGDCDYIIGTFTANSSTMNILENLPVGSDGNINALVVRTVPPSTPPTIRAAMANGNNLQLTWPVDHIGWTLEVETSLPQTANWVRIPASTTTNQVLMPTSGNSYQFYRLVYP